MKTATIIILYIVIAINVQGQPWASLSSPTTQNLSSLYFLNKDTGFVAGASGTILKTTNGGATWITLTSPTTNNITKIFFLTKDTGYTLAGNFLYKTVNGGSSWTSMGIFANAGTIYFLNSSFGFVRGQPYIWRTLNGGTSWDSTSSAFSGVFSPWYEINFVSSSVGYTSGSPFLLKTTNSGSSYSLVTGPGYPSPNYPIDFKFYDSNYGFLLSGYIYTYISRTSNGGTSWSSWSLISGFGVASKILATSINRVFVMSTNQIYTSSDTGNTWSAMTISPTSGLTDFFMINDSVGYAIGNGGTIYKTLPGMVAAPSVAASTFFIGAITQNSMTLNWTNGNGSSRIVVACAGSNTLIAPSYGVSYSASSTFGLGSQIGTGNYVVYNGTGNSVTVTGFNWGTAYYFRVYEYNGTGANTNYLISSYATAGAMTLLPVKLISFTAEKINNDVNLNWQTASEINNSYFLVERSTDIDNWVAVNTVKGNGNTNTISKYNYTDVLTNTKTNIFYYRLKQVDFDGKFEYSNIVGVSLDRPETNKFYSFYPNPNSGQFTIDFYDNREIKIIRLFDTLGKIVKVITTADPKTFIEANQLEKGIYLINIQSSGDNYYSKIVIN